MKLHERLAWIRALQCTATVKAVLLSLACHADGKGKCWPSHALIAREAGLSRHSVVNVMRELERLAVITVARRFNRSSIYILDFTCSPHELLWFTRCTMNCSRTVRKKRRKHPTHMAGAPMCRKCNERPSYDGEGGPCLTCFREDNPRRVRP